MLSSSGFYAMIRYIYCGKEKTILSITDLEQLFQVYILADKVSLYRSMFSDLLELFVADLDPWILTVFLKSGI
jgi:hypothetical protein